MFKKLAVLAVLALMLLPGAALAHGGGTPQLVNEPAGPYALFVWTSPNPVRVGTMHVSVALVQPDTEEPVLNAQVEVTATPATGEALSVAATHENATIKTYYEADMEISATGPLHVNVAYQKDDSSGDAGFKLQVEPAGMDPKRIALGVVLVIFGIGILYMGRRNRRAGADPQTKDPKEK